EVGARRRVESAAPLVAIPSLGQACLRRSFGAPCGCAACSLSWSCESARGMDTPRSFSSPRSEISGHDVTPLDAPMERNPGLVMSWSYVYEPVQSRTRLH